MNISVNVHIVQFVLYLKCFHNTMRSDTSITMFYETEYIVNDLNFSTNDIKSVEYRSMERSDDLVLKQSQAGFMTHPCF